MSDVLVVGLDVGGTSTRALIIDLDGVRVGAGFAGRGNPTSIAPEKAAAELRTALDAALCDIDPARVSTGTVGVAGVGKLAADPSARGAFAEAWRSSGLDCPYTLVSDALVAYASGTGSPDGTVLIAGTGAIAAAVRGLALGRVADGHGWLLGDNGSGFWLGREAVRATLATVDAHDLDTPLSRAVLGQLGVSDPRDQPRQVADDVVQAVNIRPPVALAELAPLVLSLVDVDPTAAELVRAAADHLVATLAHVHADGLPIVLAGGLLAAGSPLAAEIRTRVSGRWPASVQHDAGDGAAAAAWLAARALPGVNAASVHAALFS
jgi:N-acetylglucosamine kinase-like BadF-type ATPase